MDFLNGWSRSGMCSRCFCSTRCSRRFCATTRTRALPHWACCRGGLFNVFGDYFFVFTCDMGIYGAGLATAIGSGIPFLVMMGHFARSKNTFFGVFWTTLSMACPNLYMAGLRQRTFLDGNDLFIEFKGALTEQYVCQQLKTIEDLGVYYYTNDRGSCEIHIF